MRNKILLHGATNCGSSNYGDYLYGEMMFRYFFEKNMEVGFYQPSDFFKKYLSIYSKKIEMNKKDADTIVYIPGGYFGESSSPRFKENVVHFLRFMPLGLWGAFHKKNMIVIGIGAGPINNLFLKYGIKKICNSSRVVTVRDSTSFDALKKICPRANLVECGDLILTRELPKNSTDQVDKILNKANGKKILFVHYNHDKNALTKFALSVKRFINENKNYVIVVGSDCILDYEDELYKQFSDLIGLDSILFKYSDPSEFTFLLSKVDVVLTCKLHTGVIACSFNKSVIAIACHYEKTSRFYKQIGQSDRCINLSSSTSEQIYKLLNKYSMLDVHIPSQVIDKAKNSWNLLEKYMKD